MLLQLGLPLLTSTVASSLQGLASGLATGLQSIPSLVGTVGASLGQNAVALGSNYLQGLLAKELNRDAVNDQKDLLKKLVRIQSNAISPTIAPGQTAVFSGGPATGSAFLPATVLPPSIAPPAQIMQIDPNFARQQLNGVGGRITVAGAAGAVPAQEAFLLPLLGRGAIAGIQALRGGAGIAAAIRGGGAVVGGGLQAAQRIAQTGGLAGRSALGLSLGSDVATVLGLQGLFGGNGAEVGVDPLSITPGGAPRVPGTRLSEQVSPMATELISPTTPTGLPRIGRFQKDAMGQVQWFFFDGNTMQPIDRQTARGCVKKGCIFRLDVFTGRFRKLGQRRMNPMNVRAFFRAGRRVDSAERICRKMFTEKRRQKTGTVRRKSRSRKRK